jgi:uncharacterized protein involved in exopolysaccharide biosynthesis
MVVFRHRKTCMYVSAIVLCAAIFYAVSGATYEANMKILVRRGRADAPISAGENAPLDLTRTAVTEEELNSEVELLRDDEVLRKVIQDTGTGGRDWLHILHLGEGRSQRVERSARHLAQRLRVEPIKKTNLIAVRYPASDPQEAVKILLAVANAYLEKHTAVHRPTGEVRFFEKQTEESRRQLEDSERALLQFTNSHSVVAAGQQRDLALQKLSELDISARQTRIELSATRQRLHELQELLSRLPERTTTQVRTADNAELLKAMKSSLLELKLKRTQLLNKFEPSHRLVQEVETQIADTNATILGEQESPVRDETTDKNSHYEWAKSELERAEVELRALHARGIATDSQIAIYRAMTEKLGTDAITQDDLVSIKKASEENYLLYVKKEKEARLNDALDEGGIVNVVLAEQPIAPAIPLRSAWTVIAVGIVFAGSAAIASAFAADYFDPGFRNADDVFETLNVPVLATLPRRSFERLSA